MEKTVKAKMGFAEELGKRMKNVRLASGKKQTDIEGIDVTQISDIERGASLPREKYVEKLVSSLGISMKTFTSMVFNPSFDVNKRRISSPRVEKEQNHADMEKEDQPSEVRTTPRYSTKDLNLSAVLHLKEYRIVSVDTSSPLASFEFERTESLIELVNAYYNNEVAINPILFKTAFFEIRKMMNEARELQGNNQRAHSFSQRMAEEQQPMEDEEGQGNVGGHSGVGVQDSKAPYSPYDSYIA